MSTVTMSTVEIIFVILGSGLLVAAVFLAMEPLIRRMTQLKSVYSSDVKRIETNIVGH
jgi:hypothetical protein